MTKFKVGKVHIKLGIILFLGLLVSFGTIACPSNRIRSSLIFSEKEIFRHYRNSMNRNFTSSNSNIEVPEKESKFIIPSKNKKTDVLIIGGGQSSLAVSYFLNRKGINYVVLDSEEEPGGAWQHGWASLHLFSPAKWSSLPGWPMPPTTDNDYPSRNHVLKYLTDYEKKYQIPIERPVQVNAIKKVKDRFVVVSDKGTWGSHVVVSATGKWSKPYIPSYPGNDIYQGHQVHSAFYQNSDPFIGQEVLIVGGGNSGAQILAEVSKVAKTTWVTLEPPQFLPDDVDGRILFERATERWKAIQEGQPIETSNTSLANIVMVLPVKEARERNVLKAVRPFSHFTEQGVAWKDGSQSYFNSVIWCTGFKPALDHLRELNVIEDDYRVAVNGTRSIKEPLLWLVGYGDWTGYASATLIGVTRTARSTSEEIMEFLKTTQRE